MTVKSTTSTSINYDVFKNYFILRLHLFLKEETKLFVGILFFTQLIYTLLIFVQIQSNTPALSNLWDMSMLTLPFLWTYTASTIFLQERMPSRSILSLTLPISAYHRLSIAALLAIFLVPLVSFIITRIIYFTNIYIAVRMIIASNTMESINPELSTRNIMSMVFPHFSLIYTWFIPTTFFFMAATIIRRHVFLKTLVIQWGIGILLTIIILFLSTINVISQDNLEYSSTVIFNFKKIYTQSPTLFNLTGFLMGCVFLMISYFNIKKFTII